MELGTPDRLNILQRVDRHEPRRSRGHRGRRHDRLLGQLGVGPAPEGVSRRRRVLDDFGRHCWILPIQS